MRKKKTYLKHDIGCLILQALFFIICLFFVARGTFADAMRVNGWFYFGAVVVWFAFGVLSFAFLRGFVRHFMTLVLMMVNGFLLPYSIYAAGTPEKVAVLVAAGYIVAVVVVASNDVAFGALIASVFFAFRFRLKIAGPDMEHLTSDYLWIGLCYVGLVAVALGWRLVITRLVRLVTGQPMPGQVSEEEYEEVELENMKLRERIALHILQLNKISGYKKQTGDKAT